MGSLGVGVDGGMAGQNRLDKEVRCERGQSGIPGWNLLPFIGKVLGQRRTYEKRGRTDKWR